MEGVPRFVIRSHSLTRPATIFPAPDIRPLQIVPLVGRLQEQKERFSLLKQRRICKACVMDSD